MKKGDCSYLGLVQSQAGYVLAGEVTEYMSDDGPQVQVRCEVPGRAPVSVVIPGADVAASSEQCAEAVQAAAALHHPFHPMLSHLYRPDYRDAELNRRLREQQAAGEDWDDCPHGDDTYVPRDEGEGFVNRKGGA